MPEKGRNMTWFGEWWQPIENVSDTDKSNKDYIEDMEGDFDDSLFPYELSNIDYARRVLELLRSALFGIVRDLSDSGKVPPYDSNTVGPGINNGDGNDLYYLMKYLQQERVKKDLHTLGVYFEELDECYKPIYDLRNSIAHSAIDYITPYDLMRAMIQGNWILVYYDPNDLLYYYSDYRAVVSHDAKTKFSSRKLGLGELAKMFIYHQLSKAERLSKRFKFKVSSEAASLFDAFTEFESIDESVICSRFSDFGEELSDARARQQKRQEEYDAQKNESTPIEFVKESSFLSKQMRKCVNFKRCGGYRSVQVDSGPGFNLCESCKMLWETKNATKEVRQR